MQLRFAVCIPVYNHPASIVEMIDGCLAATEYPVLVIDDGSDLCVEDFYKKSNAQISSRLTFVRHTENKGKGAALQTAFQKAVLLGYTHLITIDADGQHDPLEIKKLVAASYEKPWSFVIGDRQMQTQNVPGSSVFGKAFSNFWVKYQTDKFEGDSQSGFRIYPLFYVQTMSFLTKNYDFEIEVLTRLIWKGVEIKSVPISVKYFPPGKRVTHFNKLRDNFRLTILNIILVTASLLRRDDSAFKSSLALAIGVFVGSYPVYGLHTLIVAVLAFLLRMNFIYLWLGTQISIPPMIPVIIAGSHYASELYLKRPPAGVFGLSEDWYIGITVFALAAAAASFVLMFAIKLLMKPSLRQKKSKISAQRKQGLGVSFMQWLLRIGGLRSAYAFLYLIVPYYYLFSRRARVSANEYWKVIQPELGFLKRQKKVLKQIFIFAQVLVDRAYQKNSNVMQFKVVEGTGLDVFKKDIEHSQRGHITLQCHMGGWEISMGYFKHRYAHFNKKMVAVMFGAEDEHQHSSIQKAGDQLEVATFNTQQDTIIKLKTFLERGDLVGLMADRPVGRSYELILFCGKIALFDSTAVRLAELCQAELFFIFSQRDQFKHYFVNAVQAHNKTLAYLELNREDKVLHILNQYAKELELHMQRRPEQWFNFFPFWSETLF